MTALPKIRRRLQTIPAIAVAGIVALVAAAVLVTVLNERTYRAEKLSDAWAQARVVAASIAAALAFDDRSAANEYVGALRANPQVDAAAVYNDKGVLVARYARTPNLALPKAAPAIGASAGGAFLVVTSPVIQGSIRLGTVYLRTDTEPFARRAARYGLVALLALMGSIVAAVLAGAHATLGRANVELHAKAADLYEFAARQTAIFDSAMDAIITLNPRGCIEIVNRAGERMFGYDASFLINRNVERVLDLGSSPSEDFLLRLGVSREALRGGALKELTARRSDGTAFPVDLALGAMDLPDGLHVVAVIRDISDRKRTERLKDEFVSTVSHELRTPLTSIVGSLGLLSGGAAGELPVKAGRLIDIAHANCQRLVRLINDILDIEKIESGKLRFEMAPFDLGALVQRSVADLRGYADDLGVALNLVRTNVHPRVQGDSDRIIQVVTNLLSNALKFSPPNGVVDVVLAQTDSLARLSIYDHGPGIPEEFRSSVFSKFAQADSTDTRQKGGTGLGLAISKEIVDRHGGNLWFESELGRGSVFHVDLPLTGAVRPKQRQSRARTTPAAISEDA